MTVIIVIVAIILFFVIIPCLSVHKGVVGDVANIIYWLIKKLWIIFLVLLAIVAILALIGFVLSW